MSDTRTLGASDDERLVPRVETLPTPSAIRFIKLGTGNMWAQEAFDQGILPLWYRSIEHAPCAAGDWDEVRDQMIAAGRKGGKIADGVREVRDFYELDDQCLWFTIAGRHLWWTRAERAVIETDDPDADRPFRFRPTIGGWRRYSLTGEPLKLDTLSTALTQVMGYRATICTIKREAYLLRKIRGEEEPLFIEARKVRSDLEAVVCRMIAQLDWRAFEIMVDLIFARSGWQRESAVGTGEVDLDLLLVNPVTDERAFVQIKSKADQKVLNDYLERFRASGCQHFFFVCHSPRAELTLPDEPRLYCWTELELARRALGGGLLDWLIHRSR